MSSSFKKNVVLVLVLFIASTASILLTMKECMERRFENRIVPHLSPQRTGRKALTGRVAMILFDDMSHSTAVRTLPRLKARSEKDGFFAEVILDRFTFTIAGVYTLGTGDQPSLLQIKDDFLSSETEANNIFENVLKGGARTVAIGDSLWVDMFRRGISESFTRRDLGPHVEYGSEEMIRRLEGALENPANRLIVVHLGEVGHVTHMVGVNGESLVKLLDGLDRKIIDIAKRYDDRVTWLVGSDHGTTLTGQHGGVSKAERSSFLGGWGPGIAHREVKPFSQVDVANIVSFLLGASFTTQNSGILPRVFDVEDESSYNLADSELLLQKQNLYEGLKARYADKGTVDLSSIASLKNGIERIKSEPVSVFVAGAYLVLIFALIALRFSELKGRIALRQALTAACVPAAILLFPSSNVRIPVCALLVIAALVPDLLRVGWAWWKSAIVIAMSASAVLTLSYLFPTRIYMVATPAVRFLTVFGAVGLTIVALFVNGLLSSARDKDSSNRRDLILFGLSTAFILATPARYYLYIIPLGFIVLVGCNAFHKAKGPGEFARTCLKAFPFAAALLILSFGQIQDLKIGAFQNLTAVLKQNNLYTEAILAGALAICGAWLGRYYEGRFSALHRYCGLAVVFGFHAAYHLNFFKTNTALFCVFFAAIAALVWIRRLDRAQGRVYWNVIIILVVMAQQQFGLQLGLALAGAAVFRYFLLKNPYSADDLRHCVYSAAALIVYSFYYLIAQGHNFQPSHIMQLKGFIGYNMPLALPVSVALVCFYYVQPMLLAWWVARATRVPLPPFHRTGVIASSLLYLQVLFTLCLFLFSLLPSGDYTRGAVGAVLTLTYAIGFSAAAAYSSIVSRKATST